MTSIQTVPALGPIVKRGLSPAASDALRHIFTPDQFWRVGQTDGGAAASHGTHEPDGVINGAVYAADVDFHIHDLSGAQRLKMLDLLGSHGFAGWLRVPGTDHWPAGLALHLHAGFCGVPMKLICRHQIHDAIHDRNGLASHAHYKTYSRPENVKARLWAMFIQHNPADC